MDEKNPLVFVVDDDASVRDSLEDLIGSAGLDAQTFASAQEFLSSPRPHVPSCLVLDVKLPGLSGLDLQQELAKTGAQIPIIFITGHGDIPMSVRAMKAGAIEFLTKPFRDDDLLNAIEQAINRSRQIEQLRNKPAEEKKSSEDALRSEISFSEIVGQSAVLRSVLQEVETVAPTDSTAIIYGETGTGKELIARAIHNLSLRRSNPFVKLNCAAIPTDAARKRAVRPRERRVHRRVRAADRPLRARDKAARCSWTRSATFRGAADQAAARDAGANLRAVGGTRTIKVDVRVVAATHRDLEAESRSGPLPRAPCITAST